MKKLRTIAVCALKRLSRTCVPTPMHTRLIRNDLCDHTTRKLDGFLLWLAASKADWDLETLEQTHELLRGF
eukprot:2437115-Rhodomonas_salina.3